jgi:hypothetical protein
MKLDDALAGVDRLGFDTAPIIYFVEAHPHYDALVTEIFRRVAMRVIQGVTSVITLTEVLVHPFQRGMRTSATNIVRSCSRVVTFRPCRSTARSLNRRPPSARAMGCARPTRSRSARRLLLAATPSSPMTRGCSA